MVAEVGKFGVFLGLRVKLQTVIHNGKGARGGGEWCLPFGTGGYTVEPTELVSGNTLLVPVSWCPELTVGYVPTHFGCERAFGRGLARYFSEGWVC